ncbi:hypothetical protein [Rhodococcus sp. O3]|uniref:hypothetical protein n=1 Tax=Rhodococcus sp. O3 TaxID=3404919 RepID=UPI003B67CF5B
MWIRKHEEAQPIDRGETRECRTERFADYKISRSACPIGEIPAAATSRVVTWALSLPADRRIRLEGER